jgi:hypothetical protein
VTALCADRAQLPFFRRLRPHVGNRYLDRGGRVWRRCLYQSQEVATSISLPTMKTRFAIAIVLAHRSCSLSARTVSPTTQWSSRHPSLLPSAWLRRLLRPPLSHPTRSSTPSDCRAWRNSPTRPPPRASRSTGSNRRARRSRPSTVTATARSMPSPTCCSRPRAPRRRVPSPPHHPGHPPWFTRPRRASSYYDDYYDYWPGYYPYYWYPPVSFRVGLGFNYHYGYHGGLWRLSTASTIDVQRRHLLSPSTFTSLAMNKPTLLLFLAALSTLLSGCVGTGPNTQQGAVTGGTLGAIAGAIIGHNSRGGDALGGALPRWRRGRDRRRHDRQQRR